MVSTVHRFGCSPLLVSRVSSVPTNRPPSLPLSYSPTLAHPLIPLFYSLLFFSPLDALLFPSFLLPSLSLLFYSAITRLLSSLSFFLSSLLSLPIHPSFTVLFRSSSLFFSLIAVSLSPYFFLPLSAAFFPSLLSRSSRLVSSHLCRQPPKRNEEVLPLSSASPCLSFSLALSQGDYLLALVFDTASTMPCPHLSVLLPPYSVRYLAFT